MLFVNCAPGLQLPISSWLISPNEDVRAAGDNGLESTAINDAEGSTLVERSCTHVRSVAVLRFLVREVLQRSRV